MPRAVPTSPTIDKFAALLDSKLDEKLTAQVTDQKISTLNDRVELLETKLADKDGELDVMRGELTKLRDDLDNQVNRGCGTK